jgi:hypothetical protein
MAKRRRRKRIKPRNPLVPAVRRLGHKVKPSAKTYSRKAKHRR